MDGNEESRKVKNCFSCRQEAHFSQGVWCNRPFQTAPSQDPNEIGVAGLDTVEVAGVRVDSDKADMNVEEGERRTLQLKDLAPEKKTKTLLCLFSGTVE